MSPLSSKLRAAVVGALAVAVLAPAHAAQASDSQLSIMQDDDLLLYSGDQTRDDTLKRMKALGADAVRVTVLWSVVADGVDPAVKPKDKAEKAAQTKAIANFKKYGAADPRAYPKGNWDKYDRLDRACKTVGLICYFDATGPGPSFAMTKPPAKYKKDAAWWKPKPRAFYQYVQALGKRYGGSYKDENDGRVTLPAIRFWGLWNEPNQGGWLRPQFLNGKPYSPSIYRSLYMFGLRALKSTGHDPAANDIVLMGETAPLNAGRKTTTAGMGPRTFINELFCGPGSTKIGCGDFKKNGPLQATAYAHHPYTKTLSPLEVDPDPDSITMANFGQIGDLLDSLAASTGNVAAGMKLISTEYGYETNPPDVTLKTTQAQQAQYLQLGDWITFTNPRVIGNTQFLLRDAKPNKRYKKNSRNYWGTYQSGLFGSTGTPKPAASAYPFQFLAINPVVDPAGTRTFTAWGQLRFLPNTISAAAPQSVTLQSAPAANGPWTDVGPISVTNANGFFNQPVTVGGPGFYRVSWTGPSGQAASQPQQVQ